MNRIAFWTAVLFLFPNSAWARPGILLMPALGAPHQVTVEGRVLKEMPSAGSSPLSRNLRRLLASNWEGASVKVKFRNLSTSVTTQDDGAFTATFSPEAGSLFPVGRHAVFASVEGAQSQVFVDVLPQTGSFFVVSDFDDTLAQSHVIDKQRFFDVVLMQDFDSQSVVEGMSAFYRCLHQKAGPGFALVSGSPVQFTHRIQAFLAKHRFPSFGMYLRDLSIATMSGYKQPKIRSLLQQQSHPVILIGDSGEKDPEIYEQMRNEFPGRVLRIYIRNAGRSENGARFKDMFLFNHPKEAAQDAVERKLISRKCFDAEFSKVPEATQ